MKLSIILCVYNTAEAYVNECLASIYNSTLSRTEFEVIFVDDGSMVDYSQLCIRYPIRYFKIENSGPFAARLYGAAQAEGEFFAFVDSDDTVSINYHLPMLNAAEKSGADIVINGWAFRTDRNCRTCYEDSAMATQICAEGTEPLLLFSRQRGREHSYFVNWNKLYKRELIMETARQLEQLGLSGRRLGFAEDALFNFFNFKNARKVINVSSGFYFYRMHDNQISKEGDRKRLEEHIKCMSLILSYMLDNIGDHPDWAEIVDNIKAWRALMSRSHYQVASSLGYTELFEVIKEAYCVEKLERPHTQDDSVYVKVELLGDNFAEIDRMLAELYTTQVAERVRFESGCRWISRIIDSTEKWSGNEISCSPVGRYHIPRRKIHVKDCIIHHHMIYRVGMLLFKKGSKTRAFLKKHL